MQTREDIEPRYLAPAEAAVDWLNARDGSGFELTGLAAIPEADADAPFDLGLVLCDGEMCTRQDVHITPAGDTYQFALAADAERDVPALLDPPAGLRRDWLDAQLAKYEFVLLLYYRGRW
ncbi:MAG: hypothetical protein AAF513_16105 [Pseudomonadota bacterium]